MFTAFMRTGDPNADSGFLKVKGYKETLGVVERSDMWAPTVKGKLVLRVLDRPRVIMRGFREGAQCEALGLRLGYYL